MISLKIYICKRQSIFFSHAFTIILMNCNVCILQLQKKTNNEKKQTNKNPKQNQKKIQKSKKQNISRHLTV